MNTMLAAVVVDAADLRDDASTSRFNSLAAAGHLVDRRLELHHVDPLDARHRRQPARRFAGAQANHQPRLRRRVQCRADNRHADLRARVADRVAVVLAVDDERQAVGRGDADARFDSLGLPLQIAALLVAPHERRVAPRRPAAAPPGPRRSRCDARPPSDPAAKRRRSPAATSAATATTRPAAPRATIARSETPPAPPAPSTTARHVPGAVNSGSAPNPPTSEPAIAPNVFQAYAIPNCRLTAARPCPNSAINSGNCSPLTSATGSTTIDITTHQPATT